MNSSNFLASTNSPIKLLHRDILWLIFNNIAESMFEQETSDEENQPQRTIRLASQVCHEWREVLLRSASIWAKLIRLESLLQRRDDWRNEVMRRTGSSPLWINAKFPSFISEDEKYLRNGGQYFIALIAKTWARIERLSLSGGFPGAYYEWKDMLSSMLEESPLLQTFCLSRFRGISNSKTIAPTGEPIFANNAPKLLEFTWLNCQTHLQIHSSWTSHLQVLKINFFTPHMVSQFLEVARSNCLSQLRHLEASTTSQRMNADSYLPILTKFLPRTINLSHLASLSLDGEYPMALFLDIIPVRIECILRVMIDGEERPETNDVVQTTLKRSLSLYGTRHLLFRRLSTMCLNVGCACLGIAAELHDDIISTNDFDMFAYGDCRDYEIGQHFDFSLILNDIPPAVFRNVTTLRISLPESQTCAVEWRDPALHDLVASFVAVETLQVVAPDLSFLTSIPTHIKAFPNLRSLQLPELLQRYPCPNPDVFEIETGLIEFCIWRRHVGVPFKVIDLTYEELFYENPRLLSWDHLAVMEGVTMRVGQKDDPREHLVGKEIFKLDIVEGRFELADEKILEVS